MDTQSVLARMSLVAVVAVVAVVAFASLVPPVALAADPCRVRNVTQDTAGPSLKKAIQAARAGDKLWVRGTCVGDVVIGKDLVIKGRGDRAVVTGLDRYRVFRIRAGAEVKLRDLRITHGVGPYDFGTRGGGGGIFNEGTLTLADSVVSWASAGEDPGGAIANYGSMTVRDSIVRHGRADWGGGIGNGGTLVVERSRITANRPQGIWSRGQTTITDSIVRDNAGGGIFVGGQAGVAISGTRVIENRGGGGIEKSGGGLLTLERCAVSGNSSTDGGGIETRWGRLVLVDTTISDNTATRRGGGIFVTDGTTDVSLDATSSVSGNTPDDCYGTPAC